MRLWSNNVVRVAQNAFGIAGSALSNRSPLAAEMSKELAQHFLRGDDRGASQGRASTHRSWVPLVKGIGQGNPVNGVRKDSPQCFGDP